MASATSTSTSMPETSFLSLPLDVRDKIIQLLPQHDQASLLITCKAMYSAVFPHIYRMFRCVNCCKALFPPSELLNIPNTRQKLLFLELRTTSSQRPPVAALANLSTDDSNSNSNSKNNKVVANEDEFTDIGLTVDKRPGTANFHVLQHLARTLYSNSRFPFPEETRSVHTLRCGACGVFVGFTKDSRGFIHKDFLELTDIRNKPRNLSGSLIQSSSLIRCCAVECGKALFHKSDILEWTHVLASHRLTDMDAYLDWGHSGIGTPAFFVKRLIKKSYIVDNVRVENCRQGEMEIGDVKCAGCKAYLGWKFLAEVNVGKNRAQPLRNYDQVGRFGIVRSALTPSEPRSAW